MHTHPEEFVLLAEVHGLAPAIVVLVQVGSNPAELQQLMFLQLQSKCNHVNIVERIDRLSESLVVFLLNEDLVDSFVNSLVVVGLNSAKVGLDKLEVAKTDEETNRASVIQTWDEDVQKVVDKQWLVIEVKLESLVVELDVGDLCNDLLEVSLPPGHSGVGHHSDDGVIILLIFVIKEH